jgi:hypothetical protein
MRHTDKRWDEALGDLLARRRGQPVPSSGLPQWRVRRAQVEAVAEVGSGLCAEGGAMSHSLSDLLLLYAQQFEDQHAPQNMTIALREAARELDRLYAGGCARDQSTTQYCAEAARLAVENERLRAALNGMLTVFDGEGYEDPAPWLVDQVIRDARAALKEEKADG